MLWLIIGIVLGLAISYVVVASRAGRLNLRWYQWVLGLVAVGFLLLAIQNYFALQDELEAKLATFSMLAFGLAAVVAAALTLALPIVLGRRARGPQGDSRAKTA